jgi:hypothetical protein
VRAFLIGTHQPRIAHHIGGEDRSETAGRSHNSGRRTNDRGHHTA